MPWRADDAGSAQRRRARRAAHPVWYYNLTANPHVELQDGPVRKDYRAREVHGAERDTWWERGVAAYPDYADYQKNTGRTIPVFVLTPAGA